MLDGKELTDNLTTRGLDVISVPTPSQILGDLDGQNVDILTIGGHGGPGALNLSGLPGHRETTPASDFWAEVREHLNSGAVIVIVGCNFGMSTYNKDGSFTDTGLDAMRQIVNTTGATVVAPTGFFAINGTSSFTISDELRGRKMPRPEGLTNGFIVVNPSPNAKG